MTLEQQVVSLELAKKLKELGVKQESYFYWTETGYGTIEPYFVVPHEFYMCGCEFEEGSHLGCDLQEIAQDDGKRYDKETAYAAFTIAELGSLLKIAGAEATIRAYGDLHGFCGTGSIGSIGMLWLLTEPDRLAKMIVYLVENNLLKVEPTHQNLT